ncbi:MAG: CoA transferase [Bacteroidales bacterium]|nr:CoA transferase [Bacteroidales bacterium]
MIKSDSRDSGNLPLAGCRVIEHSRTVAAAYAGRLLAVMGAEVVMIEPPAGSVLRKAPPLLDDGAGPSALFAYLAAGKDSLVCDLESAAGRQRLAEELAQADILIDDTPLARRQALGLDTAAVAERHPALVHVSVLPFGASGPKAHWDGEEVNLMHASGEGFLLPNGRSHELFPDRAPLKIYGHFAGYQAGCVAALSALSAWWAVADAGGQYIDVSVQDAMLLCGAFALQRLGDGSLEHRATRSFRYGGVFEARDGFIELLTLEDRQWNGLVQLLGNPGWAQDEALRDPLERSRRGSEINAHIREWMARHDVETIVANAQELGVPAARYRTPDEVLHGDQECARQLFTRSTLDDGREADILLAPYRFHRTPLQLRGGVPAIGQRQQANAGQGATPQGAPP